jgi:hypothetical protein
MPSSNLLTSQAAHEAGLLHLRLGGYSRAESLLRWCQANPSTPNLQASTGESRLELDLVRLYDAWGKPEEAAIWRSKLSPSNKIAYEVEREYTWPLLWGWPRL